MFNVYLNMSQEPVQKDPKDNGNSGDKPEIRDQWFKWIELVEKPEFDAKDPKLEQFMQKHSSLIALIYKATKKPYCYFEQSNDHSQIFFEHLDYIAELLALDARLKAAKGDFRSAVEAVNALFIFSKRLGDEPRDDWQALRSDRIANNTFRNMLIAQNYSPEELDNVQLEKSLSYHSFLQKDFRREEIQQMYRLYSNKLFLKEPGIIELFVFRIFIIPNEIEALRSYAERFNWLASDPQSQLNGGWKALANEIKNRPKSLMASLLFHDIERRSIGVATFNAERCITDLALAMCQYRAKNGKFPEKLDDLVPNFITFVPVDPFDGQPMRLKQIDGKLMIYSIGPDGVDNGGARYDEETHKGDITFELPNK